MQNSKRICALFIKRLADKRFMIKQTFSSAPSPKLFTFSSLSNSTRTLIAARFYHDDAYSDSEDDLNHLYQDQPKTIKHILYPNHDDPLLPMLNESASIQEVFDFIKRYDKILEPMHLAQAVLVLWDLQRMFQHVTEMTSIDKVGMLMEEYKNSLLTRPEFSLLLECINQVLGEFTDDALACMYLYLNKIGLPANHLFMKKLFNELRKLTNENSSLTTVSRFMVAAYANFNVEAYDMCQHLIPTINKSLDECKSAEDIKLISICFNVLHQTISNDTLALYIKKVEEMIDGDILTSDNTEALMKVILFLNYPHWRHKHSEFLCKCILLLKPKLSQMALHEILMLNEVFTKSQEPAAFIFELHRCTAKFLRELEETQNPVYLKRIRLANALIQLSSPLQRPESELVIRKYFQFPLDGICLLELLKGIQYTKIMDPMLCKAFWDKVLTELEHDDEFKRDYMLKVCFVYLTYNQNMPYRHLKLEKRLNQWIEGLIETSVLPFNAQRFSAIAAYVIAFGNDVSIMNYVTNMFRDRCDQFGALNCLSIARSMQVGRIITKNVHLKERYYNSICKTIDKIASRELNDNAIDVNFINVLMKTYIFTNRVDHPNVKRLLLTYKPDTYLSSKQIRNLTICLLTTSAFLPDIVDRMVDYVCRCKQNIMAFNAEKVAFLCYYVGYIPKNSDAFSKVLVDLIIRDQEKINGLSYLQSCLSLCFFNKMTGPLIKQIFNVRFMEKLDSELKNCYAKDVYPNRVHNKLMELNRTVCIDYPELNIPWFHQKFVQKYRSAELSDPVIHTNVHNYLNKILYDCDIESNTFTPYGYNIDFSVTYKDDNNKALKLAILLLKPKAYTTMNMQLKGAVQTKIKHLEMFGYKVNTIRTTEWNDLVYGEDKIAFIKNLLNLPNRYPNFYYQINR